MSRGPDVIRLFPCESTVVTGLVYQQCADFCITHLQGCFQQRGVRTDRTQGSAHHDGERSLKRSALKRHATESVRWRDQIVPSPRTAVNERLISVRTLFYIFVAHPRCHCYTRPESFLTTGEQRPMHISVIGTGYVGLVTGACFSEFGVNVTCMDTDANRIARLEKGNIPFYEPGLAELVTKGIRENRISFTTDVAKAVDKALVIFIPVGTPPRPERSADLSYVEEVGRGIARAMTGYKVIVTKSTVPVGTGERMREVINANQSDKYRFDIVSNPEFVREGSAIEDFMRPNRVVIGADSDQAIAIMKDLYRPLYLIETPFVVTDIPTAEMIKYASNAFLATKISFINEIATVCERVGANVQMVAKGMGLDNRIGSKFLHAGPGFGGSCFPKDLAALVQTGERVGSPMQIASAAALINEQQRSRMIEKITKEIRSEEH